MLNLWLALALVFIAADWAAVWRDWGRFKYATKPLAIIFLIIWFWSVYVPGSSMVWFGLGLCFSLIGDIFLLLSYRFFNYGLIAFLITHILYIIGFTRHLPPTSQGFWILLGAVGCIWAALLIVLIQHLVRNDTHRKMILPVGVYATAISAMLFFALLTLFRTDCPQSASGLAASGAILFFASDLFLALNRFVNPFKNARLWVRVTYHLGQLALAVGAAAASVINVSRF